MGRVAKAHGLNGEVIVELFTNRPERVSPGASFETTGGPLVVRSSRPHQQRWIVLFAGVDDRSLAEALHGTILRAEPIDDPDALWVHELVGSEVLGVNGEMHGSVVAVVANPAGDIIELGDGVLIPLRFIVEHGPGFVRVDPPPGLIELYRE